MELRALSYFVAVAEERSFTRAAERLHIVQPAVSQQVRRLEAELGVVLFTRTTRTVTLTAAGEELLVEAQNVLAAAERTRQVAAGLTRDGRERLHIATASGLGTWLHRVLDTVADAMPEVEVRLTTMPYLERLAAVATGTLDAAFVQAAEDAPEGVELIPVATAPLIAALPASHALASRDRLALADVATLPARLAPSSRNPAFHALITTALAAAGPVCVHPSPFTTLQNTLAEINTGPATWAPMYGDPAELPAMPGIAYRPVEELPVITSLAVSAAPPGRAVRALLDACADAGGRRPTQQAPIAFKSAGDRTA